jgi:hypothetical protein
MHERTAIRDGVIGSTPGFGPGSSGSNPGPGAELIRRTPECHDCEQNN